MRERAIDQPLINTIKQALTLFILLIFLELSRAGGSTVLVVYPDEPAPYRMAFEQIIAGIEHSITGPLQTLALSNPEGTDQLKRWLDLHSNDPPALVLLGQRALQAYEQLPTQLPAVVVGEISSLPRQTDLPGVSMVIAPSLFLETLQNLLPSTKTVMVVYNARHQTWVALLKKAASESGLVIEPVAVADAETAVKQITQIFNTIDRGTTAIWFTQDTISLNTELIFPFVLEETWNRQIPAFAETLAYAKRGLLFSLYPDYYGVGIELGLRIQNAASQPRGITLTRAARLAVNTRTARHLGIPPRASVIEKADILFPEP